MVEISSREELEEWLKDKPTDWAQVIAARAALRVLPIALNNKMVLQNSGFILSLFRATTISWAARNIPAHDMKAAAAGASFSAGAAGASFSAGPAASATAFSAGAAGASASDVAYAAYAAVDDAAYAASSDVDAASAAIWQSIEDDADYLENNDSELTSKIMTSEPLWLVKKIPSNMPSQWLYAKPKLLKIDSNYIHWINWYERRLVGENSGFAIPHDKDRTEDKTILIKLADASKKGFWDKGAEFVHMQLDEWLREARQRAQERYDAENSNKAHKPITDEEIKSSLSSTASPQIQVEDGKLIAAPNQKFDKPQYSDDLANLPAILRTFIDTLVNSLPIQPPPIVRNSLAAYQEELLVRGTQPILPIVKGLASSIAAQVLDNAHDLENTPPDQWTLKDEREWDDGTADLFLTFFKYHLDLINHFPMDEEREEILSNLPIDEKKASGNALIEPIEKVNEIILAMVDKGYASHDIGKIIKAHSQYNRDIAGLLPPSEDVDPKIVTSKRRHVLNTQGLYSNIYNTILSTASFANSITPAQIDWIMQSIQTLMSFIIR